MRRFWLVWVAALCVSLPTGRLAAEEPYEQFLEKLKQEQLFDLALVYVDMLDSGGAEPKFKAVVELERGLLTYQAAALLPQSNPARGRMLDEAEDYLRKFLDQRKQHQRRGDARLKLGELLLTRAEEEKRLAGETEAEIPKAVAFYDDAHKLFESTVAELAAILEGLRGGRVDPNNQALVAYRERLQRDIRQAQLLSAKSVEDRGRSRAADSKQRAADLNRALTMFGDLYTKERRIIAIRYYALFYRSKLQSELGKPADAIDGFQRIADLENVDVLRPLQTDAISELVKLLTAEKKYQVALERGSRWIAGLRPDERSTQSALDLKLIVAQLRYDWSEILRQADRSDRAAAKLQRDARSDVRDLLRIGGPHQEPARELLAKLGVDIQTNQDTDLPVVTTFDEALDEATQRLNNAKAKAVDVETINTQLDAAGNDEQTTTTLNEQLREVQQQIDREQSQGIQLLQIGLGMFESGGDRDALFDARFKLALLSLKQQRPWEAIAIGEFLARKNPSSDRGLDAAALTLGGFSDLLTTASPDEQVALASMLEPITIYLAETWPNSQEATAATAATVQLALVGKDWDKAEQLLQALPEDAPSVLATRRDVGIANYAEYVSEKRKPDPDPAQIESSRSRSLKQLEKFWPSVTKENLDARAIDAANALTRLYLDQGEVAKAQAVLLAPALQIVETMAAQPDKFPARTALESYRLAIQLAGAQMASGKLDSAGASSEIQGYIDAMQDAAAGEPDGVASLAAVFVGLASDLNSQLSQAKTATERKKLFELLALVAGQTAKSDAFNVRYWAADTLVQNAEELGKDINAVSLAAEGYQAAEQILISILERQEKEPDWIQPEGLELRVELLLAKCQRATGQYAEAIKVLADILKENPLLLDVQIEAAQTLEAWAKVKPSFHKTAFLGGPGNSGLFWGWGKIAQQTQGKPQFNQQFFAARYGLALNRYQYALSTNDTAGMKRAENDIKMTSGLYPELGGQAQKRKFDALLAAIRKSLGE